MGVQKTTLKNGIRVLTEAMPGVRSVSVGVLVDVGAKDERPDEYGFAHLIEHMLFQGTDSRDAQTIARMMEVGGGTIGAFTARDYTVYHATVLDDYLPFALEAVGDMLTSSIIPEVALDRQRGVIANEIAGRSDPMQTVNDLLKSALWPNSTLSHPITGEVGAVKAATREALLAFVKRHYVAERMVIAVAGSVDHEDLVDQVIDNFRKVKRHNDETVTLPEPKQQAAVIAREERDLDLVYFSLAWPAPPYTAEERYRWHLFTSLYGGTATSRLVRELRENRGLVYHIGAQYHAYQQAGALVVEGATMPQTLLPVIAGTLIELFKLTSEPVDLDAHHRAVQSMVSQHWVSGDSAYVRMSRLALQEKYFGHAIPSEEIVACLEKQPPETTQQVGQQLLESGLPVIALCGPVGDLDPLVNMLADFGEKPRVLGDDNG